MDVLLKCDILMMDTTCHYNETMSSAMKECICA
jgi:hypothetical protein